MFEGRTENSTVNAPHSRLDSVMRWYQLALFLAVGIFQDVAWTESRAITNGHQNEMEAEVVYPRVYHMSRKKRESTTDNSKLIVINTNNSTFYLELHPNNNLISEDLGYSKHASDPCLFQGKIISHSGGMAAVSTCGGGGKMHGLLLTPRETLILRPLSKFNPHHEFPPIEKDYVPHILFTADEENEEFCGTDHLNFNASTQTPIRAEEENEIPGESFRTKRSETNMYTIETAVFVDKSLHKHYAELEPRRPERYAKEMVLTIMNQVQLIYRYKSMKTNIRIVIVKLEFLQSNSDTPKSSDGNIDTYLDDFCTWQGKRQDRNWDHAVLLTGLDLYKLQSGKKNKKVLGLAWVNGMCRPSYSCTLNEGKNFEAAFVIAHEMGHCLSMLHDGTGNSCDEDKYIMSPKTGPGKTNWSPCSNKYIEDFIRSGYARCLENRGRPQSPDLDFQSDSVLPGEKFSVNEQCQLSLGQDYRVYRMRYPPYNDVCRELWCVKGTWATSAHPALDGSSCGTNKKCLQGHCQEFRVRSFGARDATTTTPKPPLWDQLKNKAKELYNKAKDFFG